MSIISKCSGCAPSVGLSLPYMRLPQCREKAEGCCAAGEQHLMRQPVWRNLAKGHLLVAACFFSYSLSLLYKQPRVFSHYASPKRRTVENLWSALLLKTVLSTMKCRRLFCCDEELHHLFSLTSNFSFASTSPQFGHSFRSVTSDEGMWLAPNELFVFVLNHINLHRGNM